MAVEAATLSRTALRQHPEDYQPNITTLLNEGLALPRAGIRTRKEHQQHCARRCEDFLNGFDALLTPATKGPAPT